MCLQRCSMAGVHWQSPASTAGSAGRASGRSSKSSHERRLPGSARCEDALSGPLCRVVRNAPVTITSYLVRQESLLNIVRFHVRRARIRLRAGHRSATSVNVVVLRSTSRYIHRCSVCSLVEFQLFPVLYSIAVEGDHRKHQLPKVEPAE